MFACSEEFPGSTRLFRFSVPMPLTGLERIVQNHCQTYRRLSEPLPGDRQVLRLVPQKLAAWQGIADPNRTWGRPGDESTTVFLEDVRASRRGPWYRELLPRRLAP
jgi:hypothetical protein